MTSPTFQQKRRLYDIDRWMNMDTTSEPSVDVDHNLTAYSQIQILYARIGAGDVENYISVMKEYESFELRQIIPSIVQLPKEKNEPFHHVEPMRSIRLSYESHGSRRTDEKWESLRVSKRVMVTIGLCHCPSNEDIMETYTQFLEFRKLYPTAIISKLFAFEPLPNQADLDAEGAEDLILIPNIQPNDEGKLAFYLENLLLDIANQLIKHFGGWVRSSFALPVGSISTPIDSNPSEEGSAQSQSRQKQRRKHKGRVHKIAGDYSMLAASPADALRNYIEAIDITKTAGDTLWQAASIEGQCSALMECGEVGTDALVGPMQDALQLYIRADAVHLAIECAFASLDILLNLNLRERASRFLNEIHTLSQTLSVENRIAVVCKLLKACRDIGHLRKHTYFLKKLSLLCEESIGVGAMWHVLLAISASLGIDFGCSEEENADNNNWPNIRRELIAEMLEVAKKLKFNLEVVKLYAYLLRKFYPDLERDTQLEIASQIDSLAPSILPMLSPMTREGNSVICMCGIPKLVELSPVKASANLIPHDNVKDGRNAELDVEDSLDVFIYTPLVKRRRERKNIIEKTLWVCGEVSKVNVLLKNETHINLELKDVRLTTEGVAKFEGYPLRATIPARSSLRTTLCGKCLSEGTLHLSGVHIKSLNVPFCHPLSTSKRVGEIQVVRSLPRLEVDVGGDQGRISLYAGEERQFELRLRNESGEEVSSMHIESNSKELQPDLWCEITDPNPRLPVKAGASTFLTLSLRSTTSSDKIFRIQVKYGPKEDTRFSRILTHEILVHTKPSVVLKSFSVRPFCQMQLIQESREEVEYYCDTSQTLCKIDLKNTGDTMFTIFSSLSGLHELELKQKPKSKQMEGDETVSFLVHPDSGLSLLLLLARLPLPVSKEESSPDSIFNSLSELISEIKLTWQTPMGISGGIPITDSWEETMSSTNLLPERASITVRVVRDCSEPRSDTDSSLVSDKKKFLSKSAKSKHYTRSLIFSNLQSNRCSVQAHSLVKILVCVRNVTNEETTYVARINPVGLRETHSPDSFMWIGKLIKHTKLINPGETHEFKFPVVFHEKSAFSIEFRVLEGDIFSEYDQELLVSSAIYFDVK